MPTDINGEEYLSTKEAQEFLGISHVAWYNIVKRERLVAKKRAIGRTKYYRKAALEPLLKYKDVP